jgi:hypothetical protein
MTSSAAKMASLAVRKSLAGKVLLKRQATRLELSRETGLCAASVTNHTRWLIQHGFLTSTPIRLPEVKRSVDQLQINGGRATALAIQVRKDRVEAQLLGLDAEVLAQSAAPVAAATQHAVLAAIVAAVTEAKQWSGAHGYNIDLAGMSVCGTVAAEDGIIFGIDGVPQWRPCQPLEILPAMQAIPVLHVWTQVMSKMVALAATVGQDDRIGYVEFLGRSVHIASMRQGEVKLGRHGSPGSFLHVSVNNEGPLCYCGRHGCLADLLESDRPIDDHVLADAFIGVLKRIKVDAVGLEWQGETQWLEHRLAESGFKVHHVAGGRGLALRGLAILTAQASLARKLSAGHGSTFPVRKPNGSKRAAAAAATALEADHVNLRPGPADHVTR